MKAHTWIVSEQDRAGRALLVSDLVIRPGAVLIYCLITQIGKTS